MTTTRLDEFREYRLRMNERIMSADHLGIKRFFNLDGAAYNDGALPGNVKELLGLVASTVLRCNDCIDYHLIQCVKYHGDTCEPHRDPPPAPRHRDRRPAEGGGAESRKQ